MVLAGCLIGGCQGLATEWQTESVAAGESPLRREGGGFDPQQAEHMVQRDPRSSNRFYVSRFAGAEAFAALAAFKTGPSYVVEERTTASYVADLLPDVEVDWGEAGRAASRLGNVPYRLFRIPADSLSCVGFAQPVGESSDDRGRKSDLVLGYFCQAETEPLSAARATELVRQVALVRPR